MTVGLRLAWRNLWRHKRRTWLTTGAMIFSNVLLVFLISWQFAMYDLMVNNSLRLLNGHLQLQDPRYLEKPRIDYSFSITDKQLQQITQIDNITALTKRAESFALASSEERSYGMQIIGVEPDSEKKVSSLPGLIKSGRYLANNSLANNSLENNDAAEIVIGSALARNLRVAIGDEITIFGSGRDGSTAAAVLTLVGIFETSANDIDRALGFISLQQFDTIFSMQGEIHRLVILTNDVDNIDLTAKKFPDFAKEIALRDWNAIQPELKQAIQSDMASSWFMYIVLIILVAFSVLNTQLMSVLERTREYGIMLALGLSPWRLGRLVLSETALMASLGFILGAALGSALVLYLGHTGFTFPGMEDMAAQFNLPATIHPGLTLFSASLGPALIFGASILAAIYPILRLHRLHIVQAMRAP